MLDSFGWGNMTPAVQFMMMPVYADLLRVQAIEFNDQVRKSGHITILENVSIDSIMMENNTIYGVIGH